MAAAVDVTTASSSRLPSHSVSQASHHHSEHSLSHDSINNNNNNNNNATTHSEQQSHTVPQRSETRRQDENDIANKDYLVSCRCDSARAVSTLLSCLTSTISSSSNSSSSKNTKSIQPVTVFCAPTALTFHVYGTTARQCQASVDMNRSLFSEYTVTREGEFSVNLVSVLECILLLGTNPSSHTKLSLAFCSANQILELELLEPGGVLSTAAIPGLTLPLTAASPSQSLALAFSSSPICARVLLKSEWLKQACMELELVTGATTCTVAVTTLSLQIATVGHVGECVVTLPNIPTNQNSSLLSLEASQDSKPQSYPLTSFKLGMRGLDIAEETCLTINQLGMMAIQHQVLDDVGSGQANFVDFLMTCLEEEEDDDDNEQQQDEAPLSLGWNSRTSQQQQQHQHEEGSDDDDESLPPVSAATPLFGTVVQETATNVTRGLVRSRRRPRSSASVRESQANNENNRRQEQEEPLDVTAPVTPTTRFGRITARRGNQGIAAVAAREEEEQGSSSPELVYGEEE